MAGKEAAPSVLASMEGGLSLRKSCEAHEVAIGSFLRWVEEDEVLAEQYARARARLLDVQAEELEDIGDQAARAETAVEVAGLKLKSDNRKWLLSKLAPKKYGDRLETTHLGPNGGPVQIMATQHDQDL